MKESKFDACKLRRNMNNSFSSSLTFNQYFDAVDFFSRLAFHVLKLVKPVCD